MEEVKAPQIIVPVNAEPMTPEQAAKGERTVTMVFEKPVHLTVEQNQSIFYPKGVHEVPERYADHWYLKAHQARRYARPIAAPEVSQPQQARQQSGNTNRRNNSPK